MLVGVFVAGGLACADPPPPETPEVPPDPFAHEDDNVDVGKARDIIKVAKGILDEEQDLD